MANKRMIRIVPKAKHSLFRSFWYAFKGIYFAFRNERNFFIEMCIGIVSLVAAIFFKISRVEMITVIILCGNVLFLELINTAMEKICDLYIGQKIDKQVKIIKDCAAGAVLIMCIFSIASGLIIFIPYFLKLILN